MSQESDQVRLLKMSFQSTDEIERLKRDANIYK